MALTKDDWKWLIACSGGAVDFPAGRKGELSDAEARQLELDKKLIEQGAQERALKDSLLTAALAELEATREPMREDSRFDTEVKGKLFGTNTVKTGGDVAQRDAWDARQDGPKTKSVSDNSKGDKRTALPSEPPKPGAEAGLAGVESPDKVTAGKSQVGKLTELMDKVIGKSDELGAVRTERWFIDIKQRKLATRSELLFGEGDKLTDEIMSELWTPLTREGIIGDTFIPDRFSKTQKMLDGSNEYYVKECKEKGGAIGFNLTSLAKGSVDLAGGVTKAVLSGVTGFDAHALPADKAAEAAQLTLGIAALLDTGLDAISMMDDARQAGTFSVAGFRGTINGLALGIGRVVAGATGVDTLGLAITDGVAAGMAAVDIGGKVAIWARDKRRGDFNWRELYSELGAAMTKSIGDLAKSTLADASDNTSGTLSTDLAHASTVAGEAFNLAAAAMEKNAVKMVAEGDWKGVFKLLASAGESAAVTLPNILKYDAEYNDSNNLAAQTKSTATAKVVNDGVSQVRQGLDDGLNLLGDKGSEKRGEHRAAKGKGEPTTTNKRRLREDEIKAAFDKREKEMTEKVEADELQRLAAEQAEARASYRASLTCLGEPDPNTAQYKTIAKLMADIDKERAIWAVVTAISTGGIAVAAVFVPALGGVSEVVKFTANIKAAADRLSAMLDWMSSRKDAKSAASPYATSFENLFANQRNQMAHYSVQAAANAIKALLAVGELSPYAPAFKVAGAAVGAAASAEALIFKTYNRVALVKAWKKTKKALDDPKNRKLGLIARELNPTLAKYTIAYGAMIEKDEVAIRAMGNIGLDRETLTRAGDKVADVKQYMQKLYVDNNVVLGKLDAKKSAVKVPNPALNPKAWSTSVLLWQRADDIKGEPPEQIMRGLAIAAQFEGQPVEKLDPAKTALYRRALEQLHGAFMACSASTVGPSTANGAAHYADIAFAKLDMLGFMQSLDAPVAA